MKTYIAKIMIAGSMLASCMFAQTATTPAPTPKVQNKVNARRENQQDRIGQGVKSGQLTAKETAHLENKEAKINHEVHAERKANGGALTAQERKQVNRQQNKVSNQIYDDKHNAQQQPK